MKMNRGAALSLAVAAALALPACGSSGGGPTTPSGPTQANVRVTPSSGLVSLSPLANYNYRIAITFTVAESAGVGASVNFIRLHFRVGSTELERQEIGASTIIAQAGTNRLGASTTATLRTTFDFNDGSTDNVTYEMGFTDDRGNNLTATGPITLTF